MTEATAAEIAAINLLEVARVSELDRRAIAIFLQKTDGDLFERMDGESAEALMTFYDRVDQRQRVAESEIEICNTVKARLLVVLTRWEEQLKN